MIGDIDNLFLTINQKEITMLEEPIKIPKKEV